MVRVRRVKRDCPGGAFEFLDFPTRDQGALEILKTKQTLGDVLMLLRIFR